MVKSVRWMLDVQRCVNIFSIAALIQNKFSNEKFNFIIIIIIMRTSNGLLIIESTQSNLNEP